MQSAFSRCLLSLFAVLALSCENSTPDTAIRVVVDSDLAVGSELTTIRVRVLDADDKGEQQRQDFSLASQDDESGGHTIPFAFRLAQRDNDALEFRLVVTGRGPLGPDGEEIDVAEQQVITSFRPRTTRHLDIFLARACLGDLCDQESGDMTCNPSSGRCEPVEIRDDLPAATTMDAGTEDAGDGGDGNRNAEPAEAAAPEYALGAPGKPCAPELEQTLACDGHASRRVVKCQQGTWTVLQTCAQNERCDSRLGTDQGTCAPISEACSGKSAGDVCDGAERVACGADLVSVAPNPCPAHAHCSDSAPELCECEAGYEDGEDGECLDVDECAMPDLCPAAYPCTQTEPPGYVCLGQFADWPMPDATPGAKYAPSYHTTTVPGAVIDNVTGLMWQQPLPGTEGSLDAWYEGCTGMRGVVGDLCTWGQAKRYCSDLVLAGEGDWRLPSKIELVSIFEEIRSGPSIDPAAFPNTPSEGFWTSSPSISGENEAWCVGFDNAFMGSGTANNIAPCAAMDALRVRCVRGLPRTGSTSTARYIVDLSADTIEDTRTGLTWQRSLSEDTFSWMPANSYCAGLGNGFRLPALKELLTIVDPSFEQSPDFLNAFPSEPAVSAWSSSPSMASSFPGNMPTAWSVSVPGGIAASSMRGNRSLRARCVR